MTKKRVVSIFQAESNEENTIKIKESVVPMLYPQKKQAFRG